MNKGYFKGWYFKCCAEDDTIAFIPAYHRSGNTQTASLQVVMNDKAYNIPFNSLKYTEKPLNIRIGDCRFSKNGATFNLQNKEIALRGTLRFSSISPIRYDIMGPFALVPFMQCRHSVYSMRHRVDGEITVNGKPLEFKNGVGYIEGDRGSSFPKNYVWTQCHFKNGSIMLSVADIPFGRLHFTGIIGVIKIGAKEYRIATYLGATLKAIGDNAVTVKQGKYQLTVKLIEKHAQPLNAPISGKMTRTIHESASCKAYYRFTHNGIPLCEFTSDRASFEFEY